MAKHNASVVVAILLTAFSLAFNGLAEPVSSSLAARAVNTLISQGDQMECPIDGAVSSVRRWENLPQAARDYVQMIERALDCPITAISVGPERDSIIFR